MYDVYRRRKALDHIGRLQVRSEAMITRIKDDECTKRKARAEARRSRIPGSADSKRSSVGWQFLNQYTFPNQASPLLKEDMDMWRHCLGTAAVVVRKRVGLSRRVTLHVRRSSTKVNNRPIR